MLSFSGKKLQKDDMKLLREVSRFAINKFLAPSVRKKIHVKVDLVESMKDWSGECFYVGNIDGIRQFEITVSLSSINKNAKSPLKRLKEPMKTLCHELTHVKQYANNEMFDYINGKTRFQGKVYKNPESTKEYWNSPWEILAYGYQECIYQEFCLLNADKYNPKTKRAKKA